MLEVAISEGEVFGKMKVTKGITRRVFLAGLAGAIVAGARGAGASVCAPTDDNPQGPFYIAGDPSLAGDPLVRPSLIMPLRTSETGGGGARAGRSSLT